jgi:hypothetical protein
MMKINVKSMFPVSPTSRIGSVIACLMLLSLNCAQANAQDWQVAITGGYSHFRESTADLQLDPQLNIDRRGNAWDVAIRKAVAANIDVEAGYISFGKAGLAISFIDGIRRIDGYYVGARYCHRLSSAWSACAGGAMLMSTRQIEDRLGLDTDRVREPMLSLGSRYRVNDTVSIHAEWKSATKSRVSALLVGVGIAF